MASSPSPADSERGRPPQTSGIIREFRAIEAGEAVTTAFTATELILLGLLGNAAGAVLQGNRLRIIAYRELRGAMAGAIGALEARTRQILHGLAGAVRADVQQAILQDLPGGGGARAVAAVLGAHPPSSWRNLPVLLHRAVLNAAREVDTEFTHVTGEVSKLRSGDDSREARQARLRVAQPLLDGYAAQGVTAFRDSSGRTWSLPAYAEMATRTAASRLNLQLYLGAMSTGGLNLVLVYPLTSLPPCAKCAPYAGKVLSLDGSRVGEVVGITDSAGGFRSQMVMATLGEALGNGLLHPQCRHSVVPFTDGAWLPPEDVFPVPPQRDYQAEQAERALERALRDARRQLEVALTPHARTLARHKIAALQRRIERHVARTKLPMMRLTGPVQR